MKVSSSKIATLERATALAAIRTARQAYIGLAPRLEPNQEPVRAVAIDPAEEVKNEWAEAIEAASEYWPDCTDWSILSSDRVSCDGSLPANCYYMHNPDQCGFFSSY